MGNKEEAIKLIKQLLDEKGVEETEAKIEDADMWYINVGSFNFQISLGQIGYEKPYIPSISVAGYIMPVPEKPEIRCKLYDELLHINGALPGCKFSIIENQVTIEALRPIEDLDYSELKFMAENVAGYGDFFDDKLKEKYAD